MLNTNDINTWTNLLYNYRVLRERTSAISSSTISVWTTAVARACHVSRGLLWGAANGERRAVSKTRRKKETKRDFLQRRIGQATLSPFGPSVSSHLGLPPPPSPTLVPSISSTPGLRSVLSSLLALNPTSVNRRKPQQRETSRGHQAEGHWAVGLPSCAKRWKSFRIPRRRSRRRQALWSRCRPSQCPRKPRPQFRRRARRSGFKANHFIAQCFDHSGSHIARRQPSSD